MFRGEISLWKRADVSCTSQHHMAGCDSETGKRHKHTSRTQQRRSQKCASVEFQVVRPSTSVLHCFIGEQRSRSMPPFLSSRATGWTGVDIIPLLQEQLRLKVSLTPGVQHSHRNSPHTAHRSISLPQYRLVRSFQALDHLQRLGLAMDRHGAAVGNGAKISRTYLRCMQQHMSQRCVWRRGRSRPTTHRDNILLLRTQTSCHMTVRLVQRIAMNRLQPTQ